MWRCLSGSRRSGQHSGVRKLAAAYRCLWLCDSKWHSTSRRQSDSCVLVVSAKGAVQFCTVIWASDLHQFCQDEAPAADALVQSTGLVTFVAAGCRQHGVVCVRCPAACSEAIRRGVLISLHHAMICAAGFFVHVLMACWCFCGQSSV
jgi:hypothetical protein